VLAAFALSFALSASGQGVSVDEALASLDASEFGCDGFTSLIIRSSEEVELDGEIISRAELDALDEADSDQLRCVTLSAGAGADYGELSVLMDRLSKDGRLILLVTTLPAAQDR
jgi:hypothetical protein